MNKGIAQATGDYLLFLNSGDHFYNNVVLLENHHRLIEFDLIYFNLEVKVKNGSFIKKYPDLLDFSFFLNSSLPHVATFIKTDLFDTIGRYDESLDIVADWKFFIESICKFNCSYCRIDSTLTTFYLDGLSSDIKNQSKLYEEGQKVLKSSFPAYVEISNEYINLRTLLSRLRNSKAIRMMVRLGVLKKF